MKPLNTQQVRWAEREGRRLAGYFRAEKPHPWTVGYVEGEVWPLELKPEPDAGTAF